jgi:hypothetical protein
MYYIKLFPALEMKEIKSFKLKGTDSVNKREEEAISLYFTRSKWNKKMQDTYNFSPTLIDLKTLNLSYNPHGD